MQMRRGFGLIQAIAILLLVSGLLTLTLKYASISAKHTADSYIREQAELLQNSAMEHYLLDIADYNRSDGTCLVSTNYNATDYDSNGVDYSVSMHSVKYYLQSESCSNVTVVTIGSDYSRPMVLIESEVNATKDGKTIVRLLKRSLQHP